MNEILEQLNEEYHFNSGGCCYVAYLLAKELERLKVPFWLIIQSSSWKGNHYCIACSRFGLLNSFHDYTDSVQIKASSDTIKRIYDENEWSTMYDTHYNKILEEKIRSIFSIYS